MGGFCCEVSDGLMVHVRVKPGARRDGLEGIYEGAGGRQALKVAVKAAPEKGKANDAAIAVLAKRFGFAKSAAQVVSGKTSRSKQILIKGSAQQLIQAIKSGL